MPRYATLKYGVELNHMPSDAFAANGAWLAVQVMAHNLCPSKVLVWARGQRSSSHLLKTHLASHLARHPATFLLVTN